MIQLLVDLMFRSINRTHCIHSQEGGHEIIVYGSLLGKVGSTLNQSMPRAGLLADHIPSNRLRKESRRNEV